MSGSLFRKWIEEGYRKYGRDPWFFLRELGQNSRDAGAREIRVFTFSNRKGDEILVFEDDGTGMSFSHARNFFFRLYASSKTGDKYSAGMYGIGFWTVLRFHPDEILIESRSRQEAWALRLDSRLEVSEQPCRLKSRGTRISLIRTARHEKFINFQEKAEERLVHYCGYLRRNDRQASRLPVFFNSRKISREFHLPLAISSVFKSGPVEGVVALDHTPRVELYARGLPVWQGTMLDELFHLSSESEYNAEVGQGLAPVFLINGNNLDVNISRRTILENRALQRVKKTAENQLSHLIFQYTSQVFPEKGFRLWKAFLKKIRYRLKKRFWITLLLLLLLMIPLEILLLNRIFTGWKPDRTGTGGRTASILKVDPLTYQGATVGHLTAPHDISLSYSPETDIWFKIFSADRYHEKKGFVKSDPVDPVTVKKQTLSRESTVLVRLTVPETGDIALPIPVGLDLDPASLRIDNRPVSAFRNGPGGEIFIPGVKKNQVVRYGCIKQTVDQGLLPGERERLIALPDGLTLTSGISRVLAQASTLDNPEKVNLAIQLVRENLVYDVSSLTAREYRKSGNDRDWLQRILNIGRGDCDIINGLATLLLRRMGIPARLVVGAIGEKGILRPALHAWTEYYSRGWHPLDVSRFTLYHSHTVPAGVSRKPTPGEIPVRKERAPAQDPTDTDNLNLWIYFLISIAIFSIPLLALFLKKNRKRIDFPAEKTEDIKGNLAKIGIGALLYPRLWNHEAEILDYRILPTLGGKRLSIHQALEDSRRGKLIIGSQTNPLASELNQLGHRIYNLGDSAFAPLIKLLPSGLNLDRIASLDAVLPGRFNHHPSADFLAEANRRIQAINRSLPICLLSPGLRHRDHELVRLPEAGSCFPLPAKSFFRRKRQPSLPLRFLAINPDSHFIQRLAQFYSRNPDRAIYRIIDTIITESRFFHKKENRIRKQLALNLLGEDHPS